MAEMTVEQARRRLIDSVAPGRRMEGFMGALDVLVAAVEHKVRAEQRQTVAALVEALKEIAEACDEDCGMDEAGDDEPVGGSSDGPMRLTFGMIRRALALVKEGK